MRDITNSPINEKMKLTEQVVKSFRAAKTFRENTQRINSLDFSVQGDTLISSSDDESIFIYDCHNGTPKKSLNSKKYGVDLIHYTHASNTAIHSSTKVDDSIRYLSLHDNKYIRYYQGHEKKVVTLCMSPVDDKFLSGSLDQTIRLWDLRHSVCLGLMHLPGFPVANFDPEGLIFAAGINSDTIKLYDLRSFEKGPFSNFKIEKEARDMNIEWTGIKFSPDGKYILISTSGSMIKLVDSFNGNVLHSFTGHSNVRNIPLEASFTPDSQFVLSGSSDGKIHIWSIEKGTKVAVMNSEHTETIQSIQFNPKLMMFASACQQMIFWLPNMEE
ncbi:unnamed protein product [Brachionus calyciflorus]|uniref:WDR82 n=1 Tax=Brachionus calyciflorus TaxID=104777 RepID=A0A813XGR3_9BILA|nr:unnamed protein product [Brachionus calyciflorus]